MQVLEPIQELRKKAECIQMFPTFMSGEDLFGLTEPTIIKVPYHQVYHKLLANSGVLHINMAIEAPCLPPPPLPPTGSPCM